MALPFYPIGRRAERLAAGLLLVTPPSPQGPELAGPEEPDVPCAAGAMMPMGRNKGVEGQFFYGSFAEPVIVRRLPTGCESPPTERNNPRIRS